MNKRQVIAMTTTLVAFNHMFAIAYFRLSPLPNLAPLKFIWSNCGSTCKYIQQTLKSLHLNGFFKFGNTDAVVISPDHHVFKNMFATSVFYSVNQWVKFASMYTWTSLFSFKIHPNYDIVSWID